MGPITLFDKSFLQSLTVDESVWFDHFFLTNIYPIFYVETLADLEKSVRSGRTPEREVGIIAAKFPEMHGSPNAIHTDLFIVNLLGNPIPLDGRIVVSGGRRVKADGTTAIVCDESPESEALLRWQQQRFLDLERQFAREWRYKLNSLNLDTVKKMFRAIGVKQRMPKSLKDVRRLAEESVNDKFNTFNPIEFAARFFGLSCKQRQIMAENLRVSGRSSLREYAPYAAYVLTVEIFFQLALAADLLPADRRSNRMDIAYLFYLPFCMMFVSSDKLHRNCVPLFVRSDQEFVWGENLKKDLQRLNAHYSLLLDDFKERGIMSLGSFANRPPKDGAFLVTALWDRHLPRWRDTEDRKVPESFAHDKSLVEKLNRIAKAPTLPKDEVDFDLSTTDAFCVQKKVCKRKGSWWQLPKHLEHKGEG